MNPLSGVFGEAWELYKAHWRHFFAIAVVFFLILAVVGILLAWLLGSLGVFIGAFVSLAGTFWLQGALIQAVSDVRDGHADLSVSETFRQVYPKLGTIIVTGILLGLAIAVGLLLLIAPGLYLMTIWIAVIPAIVLENRGIGESFGRSQELVRGHGWNVFGVIVITFLILIGVGLVIGLVLSPLDAWLRSLIQQVVGNTIVTPFIVAVWTLVYYRLKGLEETVAAPTASEPEPVA